MRVDDALRRTVASGGSASDVAEVLANTWHSIDGALRPVIGKLGVTALYHRSATLSARLHPWLSGSLTSDLSTMDLDALRASVSAQSPVDAASAGHEMLDAFHKLLCSLVGSDLAARLLLPATNEPARTVSEPEHK